jgi:hypothetical protein
MPSLKLNWVAKFNSRPNLKQFDENGKEHVFKEVLALYNDLKSFSLFHTKKNLIITLDIKTGLIYINNKQIPEPELLFRESRKLRLIYFRRNKITLNDKLSELNRTVTYFLGYQYNDIQGNNHKKLIQIDNEGNITIGVET